MRNRRGQTCAFIGRKLLPDFHRRNWPTAAILWLTQKLDGVNSRQHRVRVVMLEGFELVEILERVTGVESVRPVLIGVARSIGDVAGVDVHPAKRLQIWLTMQRVAAPQLRSHPPTADVEHLALHPQARPKRDRFAAWVRELNFDGRVCQRQFPSDNSRATPVFRRNDAVTREAFDARHWLAGQEHLPSLVRGRQPHSARRHAQRRVGFVRDVKDEGIRLNRICGAEKRDGGQPHFWFVEGQIRFTCSDSAGRADAQFRPRAHAPVGAARVEAPDGQSSRWQRPFCSRPRGGRVVPGPIAVGQKLRWGLVAKPDGHCCIEHQRIRAGIAKEYVDENPQLRIGGTSVAHHRRLHMGRDAQAAEFELGGRISGDRKLCHCQEQHWSEFVQLHGGERFELGLASQHSRISLRLRVILGGFACSPKREAGSSRPPGSKCCRPVRCAE